jgi:hypothetical protein
MTVWFYVFLYASSWDSNEFERRYQVQQASSMVLTEWRSHVLARYIIEYITIYERFDTR